MVALFARLAVPLAIYFSLFATFAFTQNTLPETPEAKDNQLNVNWLYGSYIPKDVPLESLSADRRFKLYLRQTYTTWGIYIKTTLFAVRDQTHNTYPEWGDGFEGFA